MVGAWCSLCLLAALFMLPMIPLESDEVVAMGQFLGEIVRLGRFLNVPLGLGLAGATLVPRRRECRFPCERPHPGDRGCRVEPPQGTQAGILRGLGSVRPVTIW
jgi:hypothetical protein